VALSRTDACLSTELGDVGSFATVFHARLDAENGRVRYSDAGHGLTLHVHARGGWTRLTSSGLPVGVGLGGGWDSRELTLDDGDLLVSVSDGVLDFYNGSLTAMDHLALIARGARSADELVEAVVQLAKQVEHDDDVTMVVLRRSAELAAAL
jgi:serine phosphatase RsbU (regulator of sigma subunit)